MAGPVVLEFLNAAHGDAILLSWGEPPRLALVDGGPTGGFDLALRPRLDQLRAERAVGDDPLVLDLVSVSHIDDDHVAGIVRLLTEVRRAQRAQLPPPYRVERLWHNSFEELVAAGPGGTPVEEVEAGTDEMARASSVVAASVNQGRDVRDLAAALGVQGNQPLGGPALTGGATTVAGLDLVVVTPDPEALAALEEVWSNAKQRRDPSVLAAAFDDRKVPNLSSIALVVGSPGGPRALLTADARGDRVMEGLEAVGILPANGTVHFDVLQVPHHGSEHNSDPSLYERVTADHYVISADGVRNPHPSPDTLRWLTDARGGDGYAIHLTNPIPGALAELQALGRGRSFEVHARADPELGVSLTLGGP